MLFIGLLIRPGFTILYFPQSGICLLVNIGKRAILYLMLLLLTQCKSYKSPWSCTKFSSLTPSWKTRTHLVISTGSAYILCLTGESRWESRRCLTEKPSMMSCSVLLRFRFLLLRWCESNLSSKGKQKQKRKQVVKATRELHTHTYTHIVYTGDVCGSTCSDISGEYVTTVLFAMWVSAGGLELSNLHDFSWWEGTEVDSMLQALSMHYL